MPACAVSFATSSTTTCAVSHAACARSRIHLSAAGPRGTKALPHSVCATAHEAEETSMPDAKGQPLSVVRMLLKFDHPIKQGLIDYFHPLLLD